MVPKNKKNNNRPPQPEANQAKPKSAGQSNSQNQPHERVTWVQKAISAVLLADAHLGSGAGGGGVDALVARDRYGRPVIWASHLEGVLRDAARRLWGDQRSGDLFGRAGGQQQRAIFTSLYTEDCPDSRIWRSTARQSFDNRAPKDDTLRTIEYVPLGTKFRGLIELPHKDLADITRLLQEVSALGRGRASGAGQVKLAIADERPATPTQTKRNVANRCILLLSNLDPLCITSTATPDNLIPSLGFIPGSAMLGALARWLINEGSPDEAKLLVSGALTISDALPIPEASTQLSTVEVLPAPLSLQSEKPRGSSSGVPWWARPPAPVYRVDKEVLRDGGPKLKRPELDLFVYRGNPDAVWRSYRPALYVRLRNGRPDPRQVDPSLFAVEQIAEGTHFLCDIQGNAEYIARLTNALKPVLEGHRWLRAGRGGTPLAVTRVEWIPPSLTSANAANNPILTEATDDAVSTAILTLTSDLLVRDEWLRWCATLDQLILRNLLCYSEDGSSMTPIVQDRTAVYGFNGTSKLWRMPAVAIRRGSTFRVQGKIVAGLVERAARREWLGERVHEGFGRFRIDTILPGVSTLSNPTQGEVTERSTEVIETVDDDPTEAIARETLSWFNAHRGLAQSGGSANPRPSLSQWQDLVAELNRQQPDVLTSRQRPTTAGGRTWTNFDAVAILGKINGVCDIAARAKHAEFFVRWLRAEVRRRNE